MKKQRINFELDGKLSRIAGYAIAKILREEGVKGLVDFDFVFVKDRKEVKDEN